MTVGKTQQDIAGVVWTFSYQNGGLAWFNQNGDLT